MQKLILLNGPAGVGKSTIANKYLDEYPMTMCINGDDIIVMIGHWLEHEDEARKYMFELTKSIADTYLNTGHDVIIPYLLVIPEQADKFESIAKRHGAQYVELVLFAEKADAAARLISRGSWGEHGTSPITEQNRSEVESKYDKFYAALSKRPNSTRIPSLYGEIENTYAEFKKALS